MNPIARGVGRVCASASSTLATPSESGFDSSRPFASNTRRTAAPSSASPPNPYTVSVGYTTSPPSSTALAARSMSALAAGSVTSTAPVAVTTSSSVIDESSGRDRSSLTERVSRRKHKASRVATGCLPVRSAGQVSRCVRRLPRPPRHRAGTRDVRLRPTRTGRPGLHRARTRPAAALVPHSSRRYRV